MKNADERFHDIFCVAFAEILRASPNLKANDIPHTGPIVHDLAKAAMAFATLTPGQAVVAAAAVNLPDLVPQGAQISAFGPQFAGWPEAELRGVLSVVQQIVLAIAYTPSPEQTAAMRGDLDEQIANLARAYHDGLAKKHR